MILDSGLLFWATLLVISEAEFIRYRGLLFGSHPVLTCTECYYFWAQLETIASHHLRCAGRGWNPRAPTICRTGFHQSNAVATAHIAGAMLRPHHGCCCCCCCCWHGNRLALGSTAFCVQFYTKSAVLSGFSHAFVNWICAVKMLSLWRCVNRNMIFSPQMQYRATERSADGKWREAGQLWKIPFKCPARLTTSLNHRGRTSSIFRLLNCTHNEIKLNKNNFKTVLKLFHFSLISLCGQFLATRVSMKMKLKYF